MRLDNWPSFHAAFIDSRRKTPFLWGVNDCVIFALDQVKAITGIDAAENIRGRYSNAFGAAKIMGRLYGSPSLNTASKIFADQWCGQEIAPLSAGRGDLVLFQSPDGPALGVCIGRGYVAPGNDGLILAPMKSASTAWRV